MVDIDTLNIFIDKECTIFVDLRSERIDFRHCFLVKVDSTFATIKNITGPLADKHEALPISKIIRIAEGKL